MNPRDSVSMGSSIMAEGQVPPRCRYCRAGNLVLKSGWHELEVWEGHMVHGVFCDELLARAKDDAAKSSPTE